MGDEWEEKWGEWHGAMGHVNKYADKWAKAVSHQGRGPAQSLFE